MRSARWRTPSPRRSTPSSTPGSTTTTADCWPTRSSGMAEGASRRFMEQRPSDDKAVEEEAQRLAQRIADLAWAGLRSVHAD